MNQEKIQPKPLKDIYFLCPPIGGRTSLVWRTYIPRLEDVRPRYGGHET